MSHCLYLRYTIILNKFRIWRDVHHRDIVEAPRPPLPKMVTFNEEEDPEGGFSL